MIRRFIFNTDITLSDGQHKEHEYILLDTHKDFIPKINRYASLYLSKMISLIDDENINLEDSQITQYVDSKPSKSKTSGDKK